MAIRLADTARPNNYVDEEHPGTFPVAYAEDIWFDDGTRLSEKTFSGDSIQVDELPLASAAEKGNTYQYLGESGTYEHGCFYECVITRTAPITAYGWKLLNVIKNPVIYTEDEPTLGQYDDGAIIVYAGEDTYGYKKGHHYQSIVDRQMAVHSVTGSGSGGTNIDANIYKDELIVGEHLLSSVGVLAGYITEVNEDSFSWYSLYYEEIQEITNVTVSPSTTTKTVTDYIDIGGGESGENTTLYADSPIGVMLPYGGANAPSGWLLCQGQAISRTTYAELFAVIGTAFGIGDGSTTFNVPDLREATTKGVGLSGKSSNHYDSDGIALGEFVEDRIQSHLHSAYTGERNGWVQFMNPVESGTAVRTQQFDYNNAFSVGEVANARNGNTTEVKAVGANYIIKAKHTPVPADFADSLVGYVGQETDYNLNPWEHTKAEEGADVNQNITIERDGWYSIDYTLSSSVDALHTFTVRDFDSQGEVHTIMRCHYDKSGIFRQTFLVPLKAGTYRYSHGGIGTLSVYMNRRDFA